MLLRTYGMYIGLRYLLAKTKYRYDQHFGFEKYTYTRTYISKGYLCRYVSRNQSWSYNSHKTGGQFHNHVNGDFIFNKFYTFSRAFWLLFLEILKGRDYFHVSVMTSYVRKEPVIRNRTSNV